MLIEFRVANFRSFKEEQTLSMVAGRGRSHPENLIPVESERLLKAAALYGANASGKSNLIKATRVMHDFVLGSATKMNQGDPIEGISPFRLDEQTSGQPSRFEIMIIVGETRYQYGFSASRECVCDEWLFALTATGKKRLVFQRTCETEGGRQAWQFGSSLEKDATLLRDKTRSNGLVLSRGAELNIAELTDVFDWFRMKLAVLDLSRPPQDLVRTTALVMRKHEQLQREVFRLIHDADLGISGIDIIERHAPPPNLEGAIKKFSDAFLSKGYFLEVQTKHPIGRSGHEVEFNLREDESNGTQRLFALAGLFFSAMGVGPTIFVDELECSMHPLLTRKLIELFQSAELNQKGAQLVFATHDVTLMDPQLFRRDQLWLVEKNPEGASELYSLYDFQGKSRPRSTEAFVRRYLAGRYGGVPHFGPSIEDVDFQTSDSEAGDR